MCGITLIISGARIDLSSLFPDIVSQLTEAVKPVDHSKNLVEGLKEALQRRGPDHLGNKKIFLHIKTSTCGEKDKNVESFLNVEQVSEITSSYEVKQNNGTDGTNSVVAELNFLGAELQFRGISPVFQPLVDDAFGNILVYNGTTKHYF